MQNPKTREIHAPRAASPKRGIFPRRKAYVCCPRWKSEAIYRLTNGNPRAASRAIHELRGNFEALDFIASNPLNTHMGLRALETIVSLAGREFSPWTGAAEKVKDMLIEIALNSTDAKVRKAASSRIWDMRRANPDVGIFAILVSNARTQREQISTESFTDGLMEILGE